MKEPVTAFRLSNSLPENYRKADPVSLKALRVASDTLYFHVSQKGLPPVLIRTDTTGKATGAVVPGPGLNIIAFDADENGLVYLQEMKRSPGAAIFPFLTYAAGGSVVASRDLTTPLSTVARTASGTWTASNGKLVSLENPAGAIDIPSTARWVKVLPFSGNRVVVTDGALAKIWVITPATRDVNEIALSGPEIDEARRSADGMGLPPGQTALIVNDLTTSGTFRKRGSLPSR